MFGFISKRALIYYLNTNKQIVYIIAYDTITTMKQVGIGCDA